VDAASASRLSPTAQTGAMTTLQRSIRLPGTDVQVPPLALGAMFWGTHVPEQTAHDLLDLAVERGATFLDTANNYAFWVDGATGDESETCLGAWFASRGRQGRDSITLATKVGARPSRPGGDTSDPLGLRPEAVARQLRESLRRLRTDRVELVYAHIDDHSVPLPEVLAGMQQLVTDGLAGAIAASNLTAERLAEAVRSAGSSGGYGGYVALQNRFSYLTPRAGTDFGRQVVLDDEVMAVARAESVLPVGYSTLLTGAYTREDRPLPSGYDHDGTAAALAALHAAAAQSGLDAGQTVLAWMVQRAEPVVPVIGPSRREQLISALDAVSTPLAPQTLEALDSARSRSTR
jgi:aryl-alcohol dehydrogenase-like predicted oxidoreductase